MDGSTINGSLITGFSYPTGMAISGDDLFVVDNVAGTIGEYTTSGQTVNASLITGLNGPGGIAVSGNDLFVANYADDDGYIGEYTTAGATVNASLISSVYNPLGIAISGYDLFVANIYGGAIGEYTTSGDTINPNFITGLSRPYNIAISGNDLFVAEYGSGAVAEYGTDGSTVNASLISGLDYPMGIAVGPVPEPIFRGNGRIGNHRLLASATPQIVFIRNSARRHSTSATGRWLAYSRRSSARVPEISSAMFHVPSCCIASSGDGMPPCYVAFVPVVGPWR
ncbi:MAG: hypothetical protein ACREFR_20070 [Limisphaerales bacterium]